MLDTAEKIFERIIHGRIEEYSDRHLLNSSDSQGPFHFRLIKLVADTSRNTIDGKKWKNGEKEYCLVVTLYIKNAFNSARWD